MALPSKPQTFALENCRDVLEKLNWEVEGFRTAPRHDPQGLAFRAFNAAVTAWHVADWVWEDMTPTQRAAIPAATKTEFQNFVRGACRALHLCRQVATASKHQTVTLYADATVDVRVSAATMVNVTTIGGMPGDLSGVSSNVPVHWILKFVDGSASILAQDVFKDALQYWTHLIYGRGIAA